MKLYHFTSEVHLESILGDRYLKAVESNISLRREHSGPDVVWLTTHETADAGLGLQSSSVDKGAIRFTLELDKRQIHKWREWARSKGSSTETIATLAQAGGSGSWRITEGPVGLERWVEVRNMRTGEVLLNHEQLGRALADHDNE